MSEEPKHDAADDEFEEISSDEVDRIVEALDVLIESTTSENIKTYLEEASANIYFLIYEDEQESEAA